MDFRTDLAIESADMCGNCEGVSVSRRDEDGFFVTEVRIETERAEKATGRPVGRYLTVETGELSQTRESETLERLLAGKIRMLLGGSRNTLVIGVGNVDITPDALGPFTADGVLATRHLMGEFAKSIGLTGLRCVSVLSPGVLGKTGLESVEVIRALCEAAQPDAVIAVDALAAADAERLGTTVQICDSGISPGSGVGNRRSEISRKTLGIPVVAIGVPTVADSSCFGRGGFIVTPREIDLLISRAAATLSHAINFALQPELDREVLNALI